MKESELGQQEARTYYIYDDLGLLRYVLTPEFVSSLGTTASLTPTTDGIQKLCYYYKYDGRKRIVTKQLPGASPVQMMYDKRDRLVYSQDGEQADAGKWSFTKYDALNRPIITGEVADTRDSTIVQTDIDNTFASYPYEARGSPVHGYTNNSYPSNITENDCYSISYYDDYTFDYPDTEATDCDFLATGGVSSQDVTYQTKGFVTGTKTKVIMPSGTTSVKGWLYSLNYYDKKGRLIQSVQENHLDGLDRISNLYNFSNQITKSTHDHSTVVGSNTINLTEVTENIYDHQGRLLEVKHQIDQNDKVLLSAMKYNELGQLVEKYLNGDGDYTGASSALQRIDYGYNIRGWLTDINDPETLGDDLFGMKLCYTDIDDLIPISPDMQYNGNIAATIWNASGPNEGMQAYDYLYDDMNRLLAADYSDFASNWNNNAFDVYGRGELNSQIEYDLNGNIQSLKRVSHGTSLLHDLHYRYEGNQLMALGTQGNDASSNDQYQYDENGNLEADQNKSLAIAYNYLNLPKKVDYNSGEKLLYYTYDALGNKLRYNVYDNNQSDFIENKSYIGNIVYDETDGTEYDILYILTSEGRIVEDAGIYQYEYFLKDHLGNTRIRCREKDSEPYVQQESHYYPFGLQFGGTYNQMIEGENTILSNSKELQDEMLGSENLDWYDYGARFYDPALGRWHVPDPLAEKYFEYSPYVYVYNNPIYFIDPDGLEGGPYDKWKGLSPAEKEFVKKNTGASVKINRNANKAWRRTEKIFGHQGAGDKSDAFRHTMWQALNTQGVGAEKTQEYADAHETATPPGQEKHKEMDDHNNSLGIQIGLDNPDASVKEIIEIVLNALDEGQGVEIDPTTGQIIPTTPDPTPPAPEPDPEPEMKPESENEEEEN